MQLYFCRFAGSGTEHDPYRLTVRDHVAASVILGICDLRRNPALPDGYAIVWGDLSETAHSAIIADPLCHYIDPLAADGVGALNFYDVMDSPVVLALLQQRGVDVSSVSSLSTVSDVLRLAFPGMR